MSDEVEKIIELHGGRDKLYNILKKGAENKKWIKNNQDILKKDYLDKYVAVLDKKVINSHKDLRELLKIINKKYPDNNEIAIEYIGPKEDIEYFL